VDGTSKLVRERERAILDFRIGMPTCNDESNEAHDHVLSGGLRPFAAIRHLRRLRPLSALNTPPELRRLTVHDRFEPILESLRQFGQELRHPKVTFLA
jgi:hypothetical protein